MKTSKFILALLLLFSIVTFSQEKGIYLVNKKYKDSIFLQENKRIKIRTIEGKSISGKFIIVDENTISIKGKDFALDSIVKIRSASTFSSIARPVSIILGSVLVINGIAFVAIGGIAALYGGILLLPGIPMFIIPLSTNKHELSKWEYRIEN